MTAVPEALHAAGTDNWLTPPEIFDPLHAEFKFDIDLAASDGHERVPFHVPRHSLTLSWHRLARTGWLNPPYSDDAAFVRKAAEEARKGFTTVMLLFAKTDVAWWHDIVMKEAAEVRLIRGRVNFLAGDDMVVRRKKKDVYVDVEIKAGERVGPAPKGSCIVVFKPLTTATERALYRPNNAPRFSTFEPQ